MTPELRIKFNQTVDRAVQPVRERQAAGFRTIYLDAFVAAQTRLDQGENTIVYSAFRQPKDNKNGEANYGGLQGLNFVPSHGVEVITHGSAQTMFAFNKEDKLIRNHKVLNYVFGASVTRELDQVETEATLDFISAPHLNSDQLVIARRLTEGEEAYLQTELARNAEVAAKLQADLDEIDKMQRRSWHDAQNFPLY